jgi:hypothetical protein
VVGDSNLYHGIWGGNIGRYTKAEEVELVKIMETYGLTSLLKARTMKYKENGSASTIDLSLVTFNLLNRLIKCQIQEDLNHDSDQLLIATCLDLRVVQDKKQRRRNWKEMGKKHLHLVSTNIYRRKNGQEPKQPWIDMYKRLPQLSQKLSKHQSPRADRHQWSGPDETESAAQSERMQNARDGYTAQNIRKKRGKHAVRPGTRRAERSTRL